MENLLSIPSKILPYERALVTLRQIKFSGMGK